jgi:hypothetical protein
MRKISVVLLVLVSICFSCEKEEDPQNSGEIILSSEKLQSGQVYSYYGFTFDDGKIAIYSAGTSITADLYVISFEFNQVVEITLQSSNQIDAFNNEGTFQSATEAESYYNSYTEVTTDHFLPQALGVDVNQVWTIQTVSDTYAKIWIKDIQHKTGTLGDFVELTIQYHYQPDGTKSFPP